MSEEEYEYEEEYGYEYDEDEEVEYYAVRPNKSQQKRDMAALFALGEELSGALFALGEELSGLPEAQLKTFELPENLHKAIVQVAGMPPKGARKRQLKFIAGQLHKIDIEPIQEGLARIKSKSAHAVREHHIIERWRDRLIAEGNEALAELLDEQPQADRQQLRQLLRNAQKEAAAGKPPRSSRLLYRYLKEVFEFDGYKSADDEPVDDDSESDL
jgi:ribosome-associated protein